MALKLARGRWGVAVADQQGKILWSVNLDVPFVPASTVKLLTTGFARSLVGGDARRDTRVIGVGQLSDAGEWKGRWWLELNGDVTLERLPGTGPMFRDLAAQLRVAGIRKLRGPLELSSQAGAADAIYPCVWSIQASRPQLRPAGGAVDVPREHRARRASTPAPRPGRAPCWSARRHAAWRRWSRCAR